MLRLRLYCSLALPIALVFTALYGVGSAGAAPSVQVGVGFACSTTAVNGVICWGDNTDGQLGNGNVGGWSLVPVPVTGLDSGVIDLAVGSGNACAALVSGNVRCWGDNSQSTLGQTFASLNRSAVPVTIPGVAGASRVTVGGLGSACAVVAGGQVMCWGNNLGSALGTGAGGNSVATPAPVLGIASGATEVDHDGRHGCAVVSGALRCWGYNDAGVIINPGAVSYNSSQAVAGVTTGVVNVTVGYEQTCVIVTGGVVRCWGEGSIGENGNGASTDQVPPGVVAIPAGASQLSTGNGHTCALVGDQARCWGFNYYGQVGDPAANYSYPSPIVPLGLGSGVNSIDTGNNNTCAIQGAQVKCWGQYGLGVLGNGASSASTTPFTVPGFSAATRVSTSAGHTCAIESPQLRCLGANSYGQLGDGSGQPQWQAVPSTTLNTIGTIARVATNESTTCVRVTISVANSARCIGNDWLGQLGDDNAGSTGANTVTQPVGMTSLVTQMTGSDRVFCAERNDGLFCWGSNYQSRLGRGTDSSVEDSYGIPSNPIGMTSNIGSIAVSSDHACAASMTNLFCWGNNGFGQSTGTSTAIVTSPTLSPITTVFGGEGQIAVSDGTTCAIVSGSPRRIRCFGEGTSGQLGNGASANSTSAVTVTQAGGVQLANPAFIDAAEDTFCAIESSVVKCWGSGGRGELGTGSFANSNVAVTVPGTEGATDIDGWADHFCATVAGAVKCWGIGDQGEIGNMSGYGITTPTLATNVTAALFPPASPLPPAAVPERRKARYELKLTGKVRRSGKSIYAPLRLRFKVPTGFTSAQSCGVRPTISVPTSKKKTAKLKVKFKPAKGYCTYTGKIKLPKSLRGKKKRFTVKSAAGGATTATTYKKTLKLK